MDSELIFPFILLGGIVLYNLVRLYSHRKYYKNFQNIPNLQLPLEGMFVRINGRIASTNALLTPLSQKPCAFYQLQAKEEYYVKRKAPSKGYETVTKQLSVEQSKEKILIDKRNQIFIEIEKEEAVILEINKIVKEQIEALAGYPSHGRASNYLYEERYLSEGDEVVVFGRLVRRGDVYVVTHTHSRKLPFMIYLDNTSALEGSYLKKIRVNLFFVLLALVGIGYLLSPSSY